MKTSKPISCITYNTNNFLTLKLNELVQTHIIEFYAFINHKGEEEVDSLTGEIVQDKDHIHLYIEPNSRIDTMELRTLLSELDDKSDKPLRPLSFSNSKWDDWYLYAIHDVTYLASKYEVKQFSYTDNEIITSDFDIFKCKAYTTRHESKFCSHRNFINYMNNGGDICSLARNGTIPLEKAFQYKVFEELYSKQRKD